MVKSSLFSRKKWMLWLVRARRARNMELAATWVQMLDGGWWMVMHTPELTSSPSLVWCRSIRLQAHSQRWWERQASSLHAALQKVTAAHLAAECVKRGSKSSPILH